MMAGTGLTIEKRCPVPAFSFGKHICRSVQFLYKIYCYICGCKTGTFAVENFVEMKILVVEDDSSLREVIARALADEHYVVETAADYAAADDKVAGYSYDCILLDIMLPDGNGLKLLEHIKALGKSDSVIIVSAKDSVDDKVSGLELGADDYLPKPFHVSELKARIKSVLRRRAGRDGFTLKAGNLTLDMESRRVMVAGRELPLLKKEFDILAYFMQRPNHVVDKSVLAEAVWGDHIDQADNFHFVYAQMKNLRHKLAEYGAEMEIKSVYGFGYKLVVPDKTDEQPVVEP